MADPTTGTTDEQTGTLSGGNGSAAGGNEGDLEAKLAELERQKQQWLAEKNNRAEEQRELEALRARMEEIEAANQRSSPTSGYDVQEVASEVYRAAASGDPLARALILAAQEQRQREEGLRREWETTQVRAEIEKIPEADREEVQKYLRSGEFRTVRAAHKAVKADRLEGESLKLAKERERIEAERRRREEGTVDTTVRTVGAGELKSRTMSLDDYTRQLRALPPDQARELKRKADSGAIIVKMERSE